MEFVSILFYLVDKRNNVSTQIRYERAIHAWLRLFQNTLDLSISEFVLSLRALLRIPEELFAYSGMDRRAFT
jgi:hypothetical protein